MWYFVLILLLVILIVYLIASYMKDRRETKRKTLASIGNDLWREIDRERQESVERGKLFRRTLDKIKKKTKQT